MQFDDWLEEQGSLNASDFSDALADLSSGGGGGGGSDRKSDSWSANNGSSGKKKNCE